MKNTSVETQKPIFLSIDADDYKYFSNNIQKASGGILTICRIMNGCPTNDLPDSLNFLNSDFAKGSLVDVVEMLTDMVADNEVQISNAMQNDEEVKS